MKLFMSRHALEQARERGISINEIEETIKRGVKSLKKDKIISTYRHIKIVFRKINDAFFVITVMVRKI